MLIASLIRWWYVDGCVDQLRQTKWLLAKVADKFSIGLLLKTLFSPFRQISVGEQGKGLGGMFNVMIDKLISRLIGGFMRTVMIIIGLLSIAFTLIFSLIRLLGWLILPGLPVISLIGMSIVGAPWNIL